MFLSPTVSQAQDQKNITMALSQFGKCCRRAEEKVTHFIACFFLSFRRTGALRSIAEPMLRKYATEAFHGGG